MTETPLVERLHACCTDYDGTAMHDDAEPIGVNCGLLRAFADRIKSLERDLAECFRQSGADPDGNEDWRLASDALSEVTRMRQEYDEADDRIEQLERELAEARNTATRLRTAMFKAGADMVKLERHELKDDEYLRRFDVMTVAIALSDAAKGR